MVGGLVNKARQLWCGQTDEGYGTAEGGDNGTEIARREEQESAGTFGTYAQVDCIVASEQESIEGFYLQKKKRQTNYKEYGKKRQTLKGDAAEVAHAPHHVALKALTGGEETQYGDGGRGKETNHDSGHQQMKVAAEKAGERHEQKHNAEGSGTSGKNGEEIASQGQRADAHTSSTKQHGNGCSKPGSGIDTKKRRVGQGIGEDRLHHETCCCQTTTAKQRREHLRQTHLPNDEGGHIVGCGRTGEGIPYVGDAEGHIAHPEREDGKDGKEKEWEDFFHYKEDITARW